MPPIERAWIVGVPEPERFRGSFENAGRCLRLVDTQELVAKLGAVRLLWRLRWRAVEEAPAVSGCGVTEIVHLACLCIGRLVGAPWVLRGEIARGGAPDLLGERIAGLIETCWVSSILLRLGVIGQHQSAQCVPDRFEKCYDVHDLFASFRFFSFALARSSNRL